MPLRSRPRSAWTSSESPTRLLLTVRKRYFGGRGGPGGSRSRGRALGGLGGIVRVLHDTSGHLRGGARFPRLRFAGRSGESNLFPATKAPGYGVSPPV